MSPSLVCVRRHREAGKLRKRSPDASEHKLCSVDGAARASGPFRGCCEGQRGPQSRSPGDGAQGQNPYVASLTGDGQSAWETHREGLALDGRTRKCCFGTQRSGGSAPQPRANDQRPKACLRWGGGERGRPGRSHPWAPLPQTASESQAPGPGPAAPWWPHGAHRPRPQRSGHSGRHNCPGTFSFLLGFSDLPGPHPVSSQATAGTEGPCIPSQTVGAPGRLRRVGPPRVLSSGRHLSHVRPTLTRLPALHPGSTLHRAPLLGTPAPSIPSSRVLPCALSRKQTSL